MDQQRQGLLNGLLAAVTFGLSAPLISTLTATGSPLALAGLLYSGSALALLTARAVRGQSTQESSVKRQDLGMLAVLTVIGGIVAPICLVSGLALHSAGSASLLLNLEAVFTMGIALVVGREHLLSNHRSADHSKAHQNACQTSSGCDCHPVLKQC